MLRLSRRRFLAGTAGLAGSLAFPGIRLGRAAETPIQHIVLLMQENRSFDHYFGLFPGADGLPRCAPVKEAPSMTLLDPPHDTDTARGEYHGGLNDGFELIGGGKIVPGSRVDLAKSGIGVAVRAGTHCVMPLLARYGITATCRASFGLYNTKAEVDSLAQALIKAQDMFT